MPFISCWGCYEQSFWSLCKASAIEKELLAESALHSFPPHSYPCPCELAWGCGLGSINKVYASAWMTKKKKKCGPIKTTVLRSVQKVWGKYFEIVKKKKKRLNFSKLLPDEDKRLPDTILWVGINVFLDTCSLKLYCSKTGEQKENMPVLI